MLGKTQFYKLFRNAAVFAIIFGWLFSGWPQVWQNPKFPPETQKALAATTVVVVAACPYTTPANWGSDASNPATIEVVGGGRGGTGGKNNGLGGAGGAGGGYAKITTFTSDANTSVPCSIGTGSAGTVGGTTPSTASAGGDTYFSATNVVLAPGGGSATAAVGSTTGAGGSGGTPSLASSKGGGGGGGAGGPTTNYRGKGGGAQTSGTAYTGGGGGGGSAGSSATTGTVPTSATGAQGGSGYDATAGGTAGNPGSKGSGGGGGTGGATSGCSTGGAGGTSINFDATNGSGGGGGGGGGYSGNAANTCLGGNGGLYGGGGGGGGGTGNNGKTGGTGGNGANGIIVITYTIVSLPTVTTQAASAVGMTTSTANGNITASGGQTSNRRGFVYDTATKALPGNVAPTSSGYANYIEDSGGSYGTGAYTKSLTGLTEGTTYYIRAYAHNNAGFSYGGEVTTTTKPAAPTNVQATDGDFSDKVRITWTQSTGATNYRVYRDGVDASGLLGNVATYDDTGANAPTITPGAASASDGASTAQVNLDFSSAPSANNGTTHSYTVVAINTTGPSPVSTANTGYRIVGSLNYQWYRSASTGDSDYSRIDGATGSTYSDTGAPAPSITSGTATASDGSATNKVTLGITGETANVGATRYYVCQLSATGASNATSTSNDGYRSVGSLQYQWYRSSGTGDSGYSLLGGATTDPYDDLTAPTSTITPGTASASDGTSGSYVTLSLADEVANAGAVRYYYCALTATGATPQDTNHDPGNIGVGTLMYQWQRSASDDAGSAYSNISGGTTDPYNDTDAPADGSGRYFRCVLSAAGAANATSTADRGYKFLVAISITANNTITYGTIAGGTSKSTIQLGTTPVVRNDGSGAEDFKIVGQNTACPWTLTTSAGNEQYKHEVSTSSGSTWMPLSTSQKFLISNIAQNASTNMDLRVTVPTITACYNQQSVDVTVTAYQN